MNGYTKTVLLSGGPHDSYSYEIPSTFKSLFLNTLDEDLDLWRDDRVLSSAYKYVRYEFAQYDPFSGCEIFKYRPEPAAKEITPPLWEEG